MEITPEILIAIGGIITGLFGFISSQVVSRRAARKDEVDRLQKRVDALIDEVEMWRTRYGNLFNYMLMLRTILVNAGLEVPDLSEDVGDTDSNGDVTKLTSKVKKIVNKWKDIIPPEKLPLPSILKKKKSNDDGEG